MKTMKRIGKRITGSLASMIALVMIITPQAALAASGYTEMSGLPEPAGVTQVDASKGIVRIQSGKNDQEGNFTAKKTFSGFVIADAGDGGGGVYIVTTWHSVITGQNAALKVVVKNDTTVDANVEAYSKEQDFCILSAGSMKGRQALPLRLAEYDSLSARDALGEGSTVRSLGFAKKASSGTEFSSSDVKVNDGSIEDLDYDIDSIDYIRHSASIDNGMDGGPLVDENGYVIGINNSGKSDEGEYFALQIKEVDKLLDSNAVSHRTRDKDELYGELYALCEQSLGDIRRISKDDKSAVTESIQNAIKVMGESTYDRSALKSAYDDLSSVMQSAKRKTPISLIMIAVLGVVIIMLGARLLSLVLWNRRYERKNGVPNTVRGITPQNVSEDDRAGARKAISTAATNHPTGTKLIVRRTGAVYEIDKNIVTMGMSPEADVVIADNIYIARMHAMVENRKGAYFLHDMGGKNGTYLNGQRVPPEGIRLMPQDVISLANEEIEFR